MNPFPYSLRQLVMYFLKLGTTGFGGPVALVGYMHRDLVEKRKWIAEEDYKEGLALAQLAPGPLAAQLSIYLGFVYYRTLGATLCGLAFVLPSFCMVVSLGILYQRFGGLPWMQSVFYGVGAAVIGIIIMSCYKLTLKSVGKIHGTAIKLNWLLWLFYLIAIVVTVMLQSEELLLFIGSGLIYMLVKAPPRWAKKPFSVNSVILGIAGFWQFEWNTLGKIAWYFTKAGALVFGSGLAIVPFLHAGVVTENHWLTERQFVDAVAVAMITPGPVVITVGFIGYLIAGFPGAAVAALATFVPCYLFTILPATYFKKIAKNTSVKAFVDGITAAIIGALVGAVIVIAIRSIKDIQMAVIAVLSLVTLIYFKKIQEPVIILVAALTGLLIYDTAQAQTGNKNLPLVSKIAMPGVRGRIDHFAIDPVSRVLYMAALGNNTIEVVDLKKNSVIHSIAGLHEPQGIAFIKENNTIIVANGSNGICDIFNTKTFEKTKSIALGGDADNIQYDSSNKKIYVGYGDGGIAVIDAITFKQAGNIKLKGHPESFQLDHKAKKMFVNVPDKQEVVTIDLATNKITDEWKLTEVKANFPMALDATNHRLFIGCRRPSRLLVLDTRTGKQTAAIDIDGDTDDIFYDYPASAIYVSCGSGYIDLIHQINPDTYKLTDKIATRSGARTSLLIPGINRFVVAVANNFANKAALFIYQTQK